MELWTNFIFTVVLLAVLTEAQYNPYRKSNGGDRISKRVSEATAGNQDKAKISSGTSFYTVKKGAVDTSYETDADITNGNAINTGYSTVNNANIGDVSAYNTDNEGPHVVEIITQNEIEVLERYLYTQRNILRNLLNIIKALDAELDTARAIVQSQQTTIIIQEAAIEQQMENLLKGQQY